MFHSAGGSPLKGSKLKLIDFWPLPSYCVAAAAFSLFRITLPVFPFCYKVWPASLIILIKCHGSEVMSFLHLEQRGLRKKGS